MDDECILQIRPSPVPSLRATFPSARLNEGELRSQEKLKSAVDALHYRIVETAQGIAPRVESSRRWVELANRKRSPQIPI